MKQLPKVIAVIGPTASGKSDFAVEYALAHNGEIISTDSRQVYEGLDIGTGKITHDEMKGVPHHMLDVYAPGEEVSVVRFRDDALPIIEDIFARGKTPIICGGTGQYLDALIYNETLPQVPPNATLRRELSHKTKEELFIMLQTSDSTRAKTIDKDNPARLIRALEIINHQNFVPKQQKPELRYTIEMYIMAPSRDVLRDRIKRRIEKRLHQGMLEEVSTLLEKKIYSEQELKRFGIEYYLIARYLRGELLEDEMKEKLFYAIYHYAKRQETWNKKYTTIPAITLTMVTVKN
ncbi:MAG: tRNA delta(2)-isopentenylpyrophosphate transferase, tRNA dimethylallyltransferase [Candidatus Parcubacteria bacterium]|jgi:tRNA dimethylallyltransferase